MAAISITPASVVMGAGGSKVNGTAGATLTAGMAVYRDADDSNKYRKANFAAVATAQCDGIALNNAANNQPCTVQTAGLINIGGVTVPGFAYFVGDDGLLIPQDDVVGVNCSLTLVGYAPAGSSLVIQIAESGVLIEL